MATQSFYLPIKIMQVSSHQLISRFLLQLGGVCVSVRRAGGRQNPAPAVKELLLSLLACKNVGNPSNCCCATCPVLSTWHEWQTNDSAISSSRRRTALQKMFPLLQTAWFYMCSIQVSVHAGGVFNGLLCLDTHSSVCLYVYFHLSCSGVPRFDVILALTVAHLLKDLI